MATDLVTDVADERSLILINKLYVISVTTSVSDVDVTLTACTPLSKSIGIRWHVTARDTARERSIAAYSIHSQGIAGINRDTACIPPSCSIGSHHSAIA